MAATPQHAVLQFVGLQSKRSYSLDAYVSDLANALVTFDSGIGASATSDTSYICPENMVMTDIAFATGLADTKRVRLVRNQIPTGDTFDYAIHDDGIASRPRLVKTFGRGDKIALIQLA